jgi:hypothetical protein
MDAFLIQDPKYLHVSLNSARKCACKQFSVRQNIYTVLERMHKVFYFPMPPDILFCVGCKLNSLDKFYGFIYGSPSPRYFQ